MNFYYMFTNLLMKFTYFNTYLQILNTYLHIFNTHSIHPVYIYF
jgi:hypothetical protein